MSLDTEIQPEKAAIFFADLAGSSKTKSLQGSKKGTDKALIHNKIIYEVAKSHIEGAKQEENFKVCKFIGDGVLLYFKASRNNKACHTALKIADEIRNRFEEINKDPIKYYTDNKIITNQEANEFNAQNNTDWMKIYTKMGLDFGDVYFYPFLAVSQILDPMGLIVDRAARVQSIAKEQQILITRDFWTQLTNETGKPNFRVTREWTSVKLRGIDAENAVATSINEIINDKIHEQGVTDPSISPEYFFDTQQMLIKYGEMKNKLLQSNSDKLEVDAIWIADWGDLKTYSDNEASLLDKAGSMEKDLHIKRLINRLTVPRNYLERHLTALQKYHNEGDPNCGYVCKNLELDTFEILMCVEDKDPVNALLTIHTKKFEPSQNEEKRISDKGDPEHEEPSIGIYFDRDHGKQHEDILLSLQSWFNNNWNNAGERDLYFGRQWGNPSVWNRLVSSPKGKFEEYIRLEMKELGKILARFGNKSISLIEIGSGTGRIFNSLPRKIQDRITYMIGIDSAPEMIEFSKESIEQDYNIKNKTFFLQMDAEEVDKYMDSGRLKVDRFFSKPALQELCRTEQTFNKSTKIVCCLLNTLGSIKEENRHSVLKKMISAAGKNSYILLSFLNGDHFHKYAEPFYDQLREITGKFNASSFDNKNRDFKTKNRYASHWFSRQEIEDMLKPLVGVKNPKIIKLGDIGYFTELSI